MNPKNGKFSLTDIISETSETVQFDLQKEIERKPKRKGGPNERNALLRTQLQAFDKILRNQQEILRRLDRLEESK